MLYPDSPFLERFARARASGFHFVEYLFPYEYDISAIAGELEKNGLTQVLFNLPPGDWNAGERGIAAHPDRASEFRESVDRAADIANALGVRELNCMAGKRDDRFPLQDQ